MFENTLKGHYLKVVGTEEKGSSEEEVQWDDTMLHLQIEEREKREREAAAALAAGSAAGAVAGAEVGESSQKKAKKGVQPKAHGTRSSATKSPGGAADKDDEDGPPKVL